MGFIDLNKKEIACKVSYWGPPLSGRASNLIHIHHFFKSLQKDTHISDKKEVFLYSKSSDKLCHFDFLEPQVLIASRFRLKLYISCLTKVEMYKASKEDSLKGVDGIVFVADSQRGREGSNEERLWFLTEHLKRNGYDLNLLSYVLQLNKRDLPDTHSVDKLKELLCFKDEPVFEAIAYKGVGVMETFNEICKQVCQRAKELYELGKLKESTAMEEFGID